MIDGEFVKLFTTNYIAETAEDAEQMAVKNVRECRVDAPIVMAKARRSRDERTGHIGKVDRRKGKA